MCVRVERSTERGRQCDRDVSKCMFCSNGQPSVLHKLIFSEYMPSLYEILHMCKENEFNVAEPEGIRQSRGVNSSSMTKTHQSSAVNPPPTVGKQEFVGFDQSHRFKTGPTVCYLAIMFVC